MEDALVQERIKQDAAKKFRTIDYAAAADRLLISLAFIATKFKDRPISAVKLCAHIFDKDLRDRWSHETKRRRVRDAVEFARKQLAERSRGSHTALIGNNAGYFMTGEAVIIKWYADRRRQRGLQELAAGSQAKRATAGKGQKSLFEISNVKCSFCGSTEHYDLGCPQMRA